MLFIILSPRCNNYDLGYSILLFFPEQNFFDSMLIIIYVQFYKLLCHFTCLLHLKWHKAV